MWRFVVHLFSRYLARLQATSKRAKAASEAALMTPQGGGRPTEADADGTPPRAPEGQWTLGALGKRVLQLEKMHSSSLGRITQLERELGARSHLRV